MFWTEYPNIFIDYDYAKTLVDQVDANRKWWPVRKHRRLNDLAFELHPITKKIYNDPTKAREYALLTLYAYYLTEEEMAKAGVNCDMALLLKTNAGVTPFIHREGRSNSLNFPIVFEPNKTYVGFYDDDGNEIDRHVLKERTPVHYNVKQWHTVINDSSMPRIVLACSGYKNDLEGVI